MGYFAEDIVAKYRDKLGRRGGECYELPAPEAAEFTAKWGRLVADAGLIDPE